MAGREEYKDMLDYLYKTRIDKEITEGINRMATDILHPVNEE